MGDPDFWNNQEKARATNTRIAGLKKKMGAFEKLNSRYDDLLAGIELAKEFDDHDAAVEAVAESEVRAGRLRVVEAAPAV